MSIELTKPYYTKGELLGLLGMRNRKTLNDLLVAKKIAIVDTPSDRRKKLIAREDVANLLSAPLIPAEGHASDAKTRAPHENRYHGKSATMTA